MTNPRSERTRLRRGAARAEYSNQALLEILDAGVVAHVGVTTPEGPMVLPMAYGGTNEHLYLHGAVGNAMLRHAIGTDVCATVTIVDGLVVARSPFHNSMNYRSVVVRIGGPAGDEPDDIDGPHRAGHVPISCTWDAPVRAQDLARGIEVRSAVAALQGRRLG